MSNDKVEEEGVLPEPSEAPFKEYLGDAVYVDYDGYHVVLTTENGYRSTNTIYLEDRVFESLRHYMDRVNFKIKAGVVPK